MLTENLSSQVTGSATVFTTGHVFTAATLRVYINGVRQTPGAGKDFVETSSTTFTMAEAIDLGSVLLVDYELVSDGPVQASGS